MVRKIHYCWFGGNSLSDLAVRCISSWQTMCPDYEIIEWNEKNYDVNKSLYMKEAYENKKWAFVSDYARFDILYNEGGLYFDTDVELIKPINDIVEAGPFMGFEPNSFANRVCSGVAVNPGLGIGAEQGNPLYEEILAKYNARHFIREDGTFEQYTIVQFVTNILVKHGLINENILQQIDGINIYPTDFFCPLNYETGKIKVTSNTRSIHHYSASWQSKEEKKIHKVGQKVGGLFGGKMGYYAETLYGIPHQLNVKYNDLGFKGTIRFLLKKISR